MAVVDVGIYFIENIVEDFSKNSRSMLLLMRLYVMAQANDKKKANNEGATTRSN